MGRKTSERQIWHVTKRYMKFQSLNEFPTATWMSTLRFQSTFCCHPVASMPILISSFLFLSLIFAVGWQKNRNQRSLTSPIKEKGLLYLMATEINNSSRVFVAWIFVVFLWTFAALLVLFCDVESSQMLISQILRMMFTFKWCRRSKRTKSGCRINFSRYLSAPKIMSRDEWE